MKNFKLLFYIMFFLSGCLFQRPAYYPAQVLMKDGLPCFSVANNRKERATPPEISTINVMSYFGDEITLISHGGFSPDQPPAKLFPHECLAYGIASEIAPKLQQGLRYGVSIRATINGHGVIYKSYFCLYDTPEGETKIHHAKWNNKINGRDWRMCEQ